MVQDASVIVLPILYVTILDILDMVFMLMF